MSLRRIAPRLLSCYSGNNVGCPRRLVSLDSLLLRSSRFDLCSSSQRIARRRFSSSPRKNDKMTSEEVEESLDKAERAMMEYHTYPPAKVVAANKAKFDQRHRDNQFYIQVGIGVSLLCTFLITPFIGRRIAYDEEFRKKYVPEWYDYSIEQPESAWTKEELHQQLVLMRSQLHERAIAGDFTPEKLEQMRRTMAKKPESQQYAHFAQLHPGVDDDEELEDD
ncbi:hypothetical protein ACHAWF_017883 [Thalassiosira exigua]